MSWLADEQGVHFGNRCPGCGGRAITWYDKVARFRRRPENCIWNCASCGARIRISWGYLYGLGFLLCVPIFVACYLFPDLRIGLTTVGHWIVFAAMVIAAIVLSNWLFMRLVPLRLVE